MVGHAFEGFVWDIEICVLCVVSVFCCVCSRWPLYSVLLFKRIFRQACPTLMWMGSRSDSTPRRLVSDLKRRCSGGSWVRGTGTFLVSTQEGTTLEGVCAISGAAHAAWTEKTGAPRSRESAPVFVPTYETHRNVGCDATWILPPFPGPRVNS